MDISLIVVTYERPTEIERLLESLTRQDVPPEQLIIVDDSDSDETATIVSRVQSESALSIEYHRPSSGSMSAARNYGLRYADNEIVAFLDDDVECPPEYVSNLKEAWETHASAAAIGGPALWVDDSGVRIADINETVLNQNWLTEYGEQRSSEGDWRPPRAVQTDQLAGANMSVKRSVLEELGGFNTVYGGSEVYEDTDVMARIRKCGGKIIYDPALEVKHYETPKTGASKKRDQFYWRGFNGIVFRYVCFPQTFWVSIARLMTVNPGWLDPVWLCIGIAVARDTDQLWILKGYVFGLRHVLRNRHSLP